MSQRHVELLIGRLLTDDDLRDEFTRAPFETLAEYCQQGWDLTRGEIDALMQTDVRFWRSAARVCQGCIDKRDRGSGIRD